MIIRNKYFLYILFALSSTKLVAQSYTERAITTAVPFLSIAADPRAAALGDMGVATSFDVYAQQWNPAKIVFSEDKQGAGITYTPYLSDFVNDIFLGNVSYFNKLNYRSAIGASMRYFSNGEIEFRESLDSQPIPAKPNELALDLSYSLLLSEEFAMAVSARFIHSNLKLQTGYDDAKSANSLGIDIAGYYQSPIQYHSRIDGRWRAGFNISNIGPKMKYDDNNEGTFLPTKLAIGAGYDFIFDVYNKLSVTAEFNKLLVPTPPKLEGTPMEIREQIDAYNNISWFSGIFKSFGDAPDGINEELKEVTWALGAEYVYSDAFALRAGYFNESEMKGARQFFSIGAGFKYTNLHIDLAYLFATSGTNNPLEGTLRFGLSLNFGENTYKTR